MDILEEVRHKLGNKVLNFFKKNDQRYYIDIKPDNIVEVAKIMFSQIGCRLSTITGLDTPNGIEILYHFSHDITGKFFSLRVLIPDKKNPEIDTITSITKAADWFEREIWEMLGVNFKGHPNLKRFLLSPDWPEGVYPLRQK